MTDSLLELDAKAIDPARLSVQSRASESPFAPTSDVSGSGGLFWLSLGTALNEEPQWNGIYPNRRDCFLLEFSRSEAMLASAIYSMKTRIGTLDYTLNGPPRAKKFAQDLLNAPGMGDNLRSIVQKVSSDLDTSDNGAFVELWRPGKPDSDAGDRPVLGFAHLDSRQCWRSFDPEFPVWYTNPVTGQIRKLHRSRVVMASDNPQPVELARGIGFCATSRILLMSRTFRSMQIFLNEKVNGGFTRAIGAVNGLTAAQFRKALQSNDADEQARGYLVYRGIPFFFNPSGQKDDEIKFILQDLASVPDGFVFRDDADLYAYMLAFAFGVDAREFWPATTSGATKADASVQNMKAQGRGIGNRIQTVTGMLRQALPDSVTFEFDYTDDAQDEQAARINQTRATTYDMMIKNYTITPQEARAMSIANGILDETVLTTMVAPATSDSNPDMPQAEPSPVAEDSPNNPAQASQKSVSMYRKSMRDATRGLWSGALSLFDFTETMSAAIRRQFPLAWNEGAAKFGITDTDRTEEEQTRLTLEINTEISYISGFGNAIIEGSKANGGPLQPLLDRAELWVNSYERIVNLAGMMAAADQKGEWFYGDTEDHCASCSGYAGRVYRNSTWQKFLEPYDLMPKGRGLACGGWKCDCRIGQTDKAITRGRPPIIQKTLYLSSHIDALVGEHVA